jgi:hypothetical protein
VAKYRLTSPDGATYDVTAPDDAKQEDVLAYFQQQVGQPKEPTAANQADRAVRRFRHNASLGLLDAPLDAAAAGLKTITGQADSFGDEYKRQRGITKAALESPEGLAGKDIAADTAGNVATGIVTAPLTMARTATEMAMPAARAFTNQLTRFVTPRSEAAISADLAPEIIKAGSEMTRKAVARESTRVGAGVGAVAGYGNTPDDAGLGGAMVHMGEGAFGGAVIGRVLPAAVNAYGDYISGPVRNYLAAAQRARAERATRVAADYQAAGVDEFTPALGGGATRGTAEGLAPTVFGSSIRNAARPSIAQLEAGVQRDLAGAGAAKPPAQAGEEAQSFLKGQLVDRTLPADDVNRMSPLAAYELTGIPPRTGYEPPPPKVAPTEPREVPRITPQQVLDEAEAAVPAVAPRKVESVEGKYKDPTPDEVELAPELFGRVKKINQQVADLSRRVAAEEKVAGERVGKFMREELQPAGIASIRENPSFPYLIAADKDGKPVFAFYPEDGRIVNEVPWQPAPTAHKDAVRKIRAMLEDLNAQDQQLAKKKQELAVAEREQQIIHAEADDFRVKELPLLAEQRRAEALAKAQAEEDAKAAVATQKAKAEAREKNAAGAIQEAEKRTQAAREKEAADAAADTARRQAEAEQAQARQLAEAQAAPAGGYELGTPKAREVSYTTELDAAYQQTRNNAPGVQKNPLGRRATDSVAEQRTHTTDLITEIAEEARGAARLPGFRGNIFEEGGTLRPDVLAHLEEHLGVDIAGRLKYFSDRRAKYQASPDLQGLLDVRTAIRRASEEARRGDFPGQPRAPNDAMLTRLKGALDKDIKDFARAAGPDGERFVLQREAVDRAYETYVNDLREPLSKVFGDKVDPAAALQKLIGSTKEGTRDADLLRRFFKVVDDKGNRAEAVGWLLNDMTREGLPGFLKGWRSLSPEAKAVMFKGETKALGEALEIKARVGGTLEPYLKVAAEDSTLDLAKGLRPGNAAAVALGYFLGLPHLIGSAIGAEGAARLLTSKWYAGWLKQFPIEKGMGPEVARHMRRLAAFASQDLGINQAVVDKLLESVGQAKAAGLGDARPEPRTFEAGGNYNAPGDDKGMEIGEGDPRARELNLKADEDGWQLPQSVVRDEWAKLPQPAMFTGEAGKQTKATIDEAKRMQAAGAKPDEIYEKTGAFKQGDDKWRVEIDDSAAQVNGTKLAKRLDAWKPGKEVTVRLGDFYDHPELYKQHPEAKGIRIVFSDRNTRGVGVLNEKTGVITLNDRWDKNGWDEDWDRVLTHELQHWLQKQNKFDYGPKDRDNYDTALGEREADNAADRKGMSADERRAAPPHKDKAYEGAEFGDKGVLWGPPMRLGMGLIDGKPQGEKGYLPDQPPQRPEPVKGNPGRFSRPLVDPWNTTVRRAR